MYQWLRIFPVQKRHFKHQIFCGMGQLEESPIGDGMGDVGEYCILWQKNHALPTEHWVAW